MRDEIKNLAGKTIKHVAEIRSSENRFSRYLVLHMTDGTRVDVMSDPEGNGPGWLEVTEATKVRWPRVGQGR